MTVEKYTANPSNSNSYLDLLNQKSGWLNTETESIQCGCLVCQGTAVNSIYHPEYSGRGISFIDDSSTENDVSINGELYGIHDSSTETNLTCGLSSRNDSSTLEHGIPYTEIPQQINSNGAVIEAPPVDYGNTFKLHSNPDAKHTIYLDFDGHVTEDANWKDGARIDSPAYDTNSDSSSFSNEELETIQKIWQRVAEDFAPFNINVTTEEPDIEDLRKRGDGDDRWGIRTVITQDTDTNITDASGGIANVYSFNWSTDTPAFSFNKGENNAAMTISHEVGHTLGLSHDGISPNTTYHPGFGSGDTSWGSIMGAPFGKSLTQWSQGDYKNADNTGSNANFFSGEDDLKVITTENGFDYRVDDYGNSNATAFELTATNTNTVSAFGIIERNTDVDVFSFVTGTGNVSFSIDPSSQVYLSDGNGKYTLEYLDSRGSNLDILAKLYSADGTVIAESNPVESLNASFDLSLDAGEYYIHIDGIGKGDPFLENPDGYTDYGSLGQYQINGNIVEPLDVNNANQLTQVNSSLDIFNISGETGKSKLQVTLSSANSDGVNELGVFVVDDEQGRINGILPGESGYAKAALERAKIVFSALTNSPNGFASQTQNRLIEFPDNTNIRFYLVDNSTTNAVLSGKTSTSEVIFSDTTTLKVETQDQEEFSLGWNDRNGGNFSDLVVKIQPTDNKLSLGTNLQNSTQAELIDLTGLTQSVVTANFSVFREAVFNNEVYFYKVDESGKVDGFDPNTSTYQQAVLDNLVKDTVTGEIVKFSAANQGIKSGTAQIEADSIIAPLIIVNGSLDQLTDSDSGNNPEIYFPYLGANADGVDHIHLLADHTFGFEDLPNGGDSDYNDLIVKINFSI
ncbi:bacterial pre-peptidase C-terminal domain protein [Calothrix parasitica NIES-267]|uniref:Bacterial pre-peptidase C-terminal domain protein n=1 Tax=Calothrix parasitica NIES-267 TaxID=1973488 RepID=A0A1Z4LHH9_9CYAN|nr:bacterial pre-peptidase C-terminal domain protein [Calothrix parasitica NIES-267]